MFSITHKAITASPNTTIQIDFPYTQPDPPNILASLSSSCGCGRVYNDPDNQQIIVKYTPSPTPKHLTAMGHNSYITTKTITVNYVDSQGNMHVVNLTFTATIK